MLHVESRAHGGLVGGFGIAPGARHPIRKPFLGATDDFGIMSALSRFKKLKLAGRDARNGLLARVELVEAEQFADRIKI